MSDLTESSKNDTPASAYYKQATDALNRREFEYAKEICHNAIKQFEHAGEERKESEAFHLLGMIAYRQGDLKDAEARYRQSLAIDERTDDDRGAARTCNNLAAVLNACGECDAAEEWLRKSIHIKERLADERGLSVSYHQLGVVAETRVDFDAAEKWYLRSLDIKEKLNDEIGVAMTCFNLCGIAEKQGNKDSVEKWLQKALEALGREGHASTAINLGWDAEQRREYGDAKILYLKALDIAKEHGNDEQEANCYAHLGFLARQQCDYEASKKMV